MKVWRESFVRGIRYEKEGEKWLKQEMGIGDVVKSGGRINGEVEGWILGADLRPSFSPLSASQGPNDPELTFWLKGLCLFRTSRRSHR